ncbi:FkbM family methyltransferase [Mucilaginibacter sp.]|uniref:FkbM family methyltransferase n=1 Tax=Mucilaginibacter sp. TaxID=1882438 RepID=UPI002634ED58|nr:FkbM family methyltransferase [Mucilaginibacter sp.]MDB4927011.1 methyltransferase FkbM [Mucilaginibacter sp.]
MNWKLFAGQFLNKMEQCFIHLDSKFVQKTYPFGRDWIYDVKRILSNASVIVDAGANVGDVSLNINSWFPDASVYAFEPVNDTYKILVQNTSRINNILAINAGLGAKNEKVNILLSGENTINSLKITEPHQDIVGSEEITINRLDDFLLEKHLTHIDILKIDVEGFEFEVLNGSGSLIQSGVKCIYLEVGYEREPTKVHFSDVEEYMEANNFQLCGIYETRRHFYDRRRLWYSNNLYIKKSLLT